MRKVCYRLLVLFGFHALVRTLRRGSLTIFLYHGVAPHTNSGIYNYRKKFIDPLVFARQMEYLRAKYIILPLDEAVEQLRLGKLPPRAAVITFDDGYRNNFTYAFPVLRGQGIPATIYLTTDFIDEGKPLWVDRLEYTVGCSPHGANVPYEEKVAGDNTLRTKLKTLSATEREKRLQEIEENAEISLKDYAGERSVYAPLSWEDIRIMRQHQIAFGAHTRSHPILSRLSAMDQRIEIDESRSIVTEHVGSTSAIFAYPNGQPGDYTAETIAALKHSGFSGALTTTNGVNGRSTHPYEMRRITMDGTGDWHTFLLTTCGVLGWLSRMKRLFHKS